MKRYFPKILMMIAIALSVSTIADAQLAVRIRPNAPVVKVRPASPSATHVWVSGEWRWNRGHYEYADGYWASPEPGKHRWVEGRWKNKGGGWIWIPGHWK